MAKERARATLTRPKREANLALHLTTPIPRKRHEKIQRELEKITGVSIVSFDDNGHTVVIYLAQQHTGKKAAQAVLAAVLNKLDLTQDGELEILEDN